MKVRYTGSGDLRFNSAPSRFSYLFVSGVAQEVKKEDEQFFRNKAAIPGNDWQVEGAAEVAAKTAADAVVGAVDKALGRKTKNRRGEE